MARFAGQELAIGAMGRQPGHALMAAGQDQAGHQKRIQHALGLALAHYRREGGAIAQRRQGPQSDAPALQQLKYQLEVLQFLASQEFVANRAASPWPRRISARGPRADSKS